MKFKKNDHVVNLSGRSGTIEEVETRYCGDNECLYYVRWSDGKGNYQIECDLVLSERIS